MQPWCGYNSAGADRRQVGHVGQQPPRQVLHTAPARPEASRSGDPELAEAGSDDGPCARSGWRLHDRRAAPGAVPGAGAGADSAPSTPIWNSRKSSIIWRRPPSTMSARDWRRVKPGAARASTSEVCRTRERRIGAARALRLIESALLDAASRPCAVSGGVRPSPARRSLVSALGIGVNTAVFGIVRPILLRPLPFPDTAELVWISPLRKDGRGRQLASTGAASRWDGRRIATFSQLSAYYFPFQFAPFTLMGQGEAEALTGAVVAYGGLRHAGRAEWAGRVFWSAEAPPFGFASTAVVISHGLWRRRFGGDPGDVGRLLISASAQAIVVGIKPASFDFGRMLAPGIAVDLFLPLPAVVPGVWGAPSCDRRTPRTRDLPGNGAGRSRCAAPSTAARLPGLGRGFRRS